MAALDYRVVPADEIRAVADRLREVDRRLPTRLRTELRKAAKPAAARAKAAARALPAEGAKGGTKRHPHRPKQLRRRLARGVRVQASAGGKRAAGLRIITAMPTKSEAILPRAMDSHQRFSHPLFGRTGVVIRQEGGTGWFRESIAEEAPKVQRRVFEVLEETAEWIAQAGG